jgi:hypothetical protein
MARTCRFEFLDNADVAKPDTSHGPVWKVREPLSYVFDGDITGGHPRCVATDRFPNFADETVCMGPPQPTIADMRDVISGLQDRGDRQQHVSRPVSMMAFSRSRTPPRD